MAIIIFFFAAVIVQGYGTTNPLSFGHSAGELAGGTLGAGDYTFPQNLFVNGKVGVGTTSPILDVYGDASVMQMTFPSSATSYAVLSFFEGASFRSYIYSIGSLYVDATRRNDLELRSVYGDLTLQKDGGNVGIGTSSPGYKLHVVSTTGAAVYGSSDSNYGVRGISASSFGGAFYGKYGIYAAGNTSTGYGGLFCKDANNNGLCEGDLDEPYVYLAHPDGYAVWGYSKSVGAGVRGQSGSSYGVYGDSVSSFGVYGTSSSNLGVYGNSVSNVGVYGYSSSTWGIQGTGVNYGVYGQGALIGVEGWSTGGAGTYDFYAGGPSNIDYGTSSSIRWKKNIQPIDNALSKVLTMRGVYFDWDSAHGGQHGMGMIAEEVGKVVPEVVAYEANGVDATGMDYGHLTPVLVEAMKELKAENDALKKRIEALEAR